MNKKEELIHQHWADLHEQGIELEYSFGTIPWTAVRNTSSDSVARAFNAAKYSYRVKEQQMSITDYVIDITGSSLADRLNLRQVLLDNEQILYGSSPKNILTKPTTDCVYFRHDPDDGKWIAGDNSTYNPLVNISLREFIGKFAKSKKLRNLSFTSETTEWTEQQFAEICEFVGDNGDELYELNTSIEFFSDTSGDEEAFMSMTESIPEGNLQVSYEDIFPQPTTKVEPIIEEPEMPKLSDLLKEHGAYEKFLANLTIGYADYANYVSKTCYHLNDAFEWCTTPEGEVYWDNVSTLIGVNDVVNDVRAPDDVEYWQEHSENGGNYWAYDSEDNWCKENYDSPKCLVENIRFYAEKPTWLIDAKQTAVKEEPSLKDLKTPQKNGSRGWWVSTVESQEGYLHPDGVIRSNMLIDGQPGHPGYFPTEESAITARNKYLGLEIELPVGGPCVLGAAASAAKTQYITYKLAEDKTLHNCIFNVGDSIEHKSDTPKPWTINVIDEDGVHFNEYGHPVSITEINKNWRLSSNKETLETTTPKETTMNTEHEQLAEAIAAGINEANNKPKKAKKVKTDYQARKPITVKRFAKKAFGGHEVETAYFDTDAQVDTYFEGLDNANRYVLVISKEVEQLKTKLPLTRTESK